MFVIQDITYRTILNSHVKFTSKFILQFNRCAWSPNKSPAYWALNRSNGDNSSLISMLDRIFRYSNAMLKLVMAYGG